MADGTFRETGLAHRGGGPKIRLPTGASIDRWLTAIGARDGA